ncbi:sigma-70 family RNA polymerase sigma factor [Psychrobacillus sp. NPDC096426]|uniref:sigma-70 family RNA polymerase sigma factor n=1 Tax=Psychrobacillus sp. NPDC096426 TaxID=3364491 RepID=UPI003817A834
MKSNEKNFIKRLKSEKEDAIEYIVDVYLPLIKGISYKILTPIDNGLIEECINDIFLSIWKNAKYFNGDVDNFKSWICTIAKFKAIDYYRKALKNNEVDVGYLEIPDKYSVEEEIIQLENKDEVIHLLQELEPIDQKIIFMKYFLDLKSDEIADQLGMTKSSIDNRIYRGKKKLNKQAANIKLGGRVYEKYL